ncbi:MAG: S46 family peptidase, partial [Bryobacterales bacterium]|nr:S46 family peptidase [Bryobacterales bacterium]
LRFSYGPVRGYVSETGEKIPWATNFSGLFRRATGVDPFALPPSWIRNKTRLKQTTPFNFVTTNDTHGGNSGSPTVNTKGEVIGILFDGNIEGLPNRFVFRDTRERSVHVASQGIIEALRSIYRAKEVLTELGF